MSFNCPDLGRNVDVNALGLLQHSILTFDPLHKNAAINNW